jgi:hypothetical protein
VIVHQIVIWICEACLKGEGSECHTPGCALFLHRVDLPIDELLYTVIGGMESPASEASET